MELKKQRLACQGSECVVLVLVHVLMCRQGNPIKKSGQYGARWPTSAGKGAGACVHHLFVRIGSLPWFLSLPPLTFRFHKVFFSDQRFDKIVVGILLLV